MLGGIVDALLLERRRTIGRRQRGNRLKDALDALEINRHVGTPVPTDASSCVNGAARCRKKLAESQMQHQDFRVRLTHRWM
jgi:hypothetical protein